MNRRTLLALCGSAIAGVSSGCPTPTRTDTPPPSRPPSHTTTTSRATESPAQTVQECSSPTERTAESTPGDGFRQISVRGDSPPADDDVDFTVTVRRQATGESPAEIEVHLTNLAVTERTFIFSPIVPFTPRRVSHKDGDGQVQLVPRPLGELDLWSTIDENEDGEFEPMPSEPTDGCWQAVDGIAYADYFDEIQLGPCERTSRTYSVVAHPDNDGCLPSGTYRTSTTWFIGDVEDEREWGFTLTIGDG